METFELIFNNNGTITNIILENEPVGYDAVDFHLNQESDRYGRDWNFVGDGNVMLEFTKHAHFEAFGLLETFYNTFGFEADVKLKVTAGSETFVGNLDFLDAEYNGYDTFKFNVNQETEEALVKKRSEMVVDMYSHFDLDGELTDAAEIKRMLLPAKQIYRESVWENVLGDQVISYSTTTPLNVRFNYSGNSTVFEIKNTLSAMGFKGLDGWYDSSINFKFLEAKTDIIELGFDIDYGGSFITDYAGGTSTTLDLFMRIGAPPTSQATWDSGNFINLDHYVVDNETKHLNNKTVRIPDIKTGEVVHIYFSVVGSSAQGEFHYKNIKFTARAYEQTFDVVTDCVSLHDVVKKVINDTAKLEIEFPLAKIGVLKNTYLFNGNMVRGMAGVSLPHLNKKPFNVSFDDLKKWFPELNLDYEIMLNKKVFIGKREDYYTDNEIDVIDNVAFDSFVVQQNERYALNKFNYKYNKYQSQKENTEENTNDIVHGEAEYHIHNKQVELTKTVEVNFVRDPFMLQETINVSLTESDNKATQDDDTIFIIDATAITTNDLVKNKTSVLNHVVNSNNNHVILQNDGSFRWDILGIELGEYFEIVTIINKGDYLVQSITASSIELQPVGFAPTISGEYFTQFKYSINRNNVPLKPYFFFPQHIENIRSPETYANLAYSIGLNVGTWSDFISTAVKNSKQPNLIKYINNKEYVNNTYFPTHVESSDIRLKEPILDTKVITTQLIIPFERYLRICRVLRSESRGFIRTFDPKGNVICLYPQEMTAIFKTSNLKEVTVIGELKNMPDELNITKTNGLYNVWIYKLSQLNYEAKGEYIVFKDDNLINLFKPLHFTKIKVDGNNFTSMITLRYALNTL